MHRRTFLSASAGAGGEGMWLDSGVVYFATTGDERVWSLTLGRDGAPDVLETLYDGRDSSKWPQTATEAPLWDPDNLTVSPAGEIYVAEDSGDLRISLISQPDEVGQRVITPFLQTGWSHRPGRHVRDHRALHHGGAPAGRPPRGGPVHRWGEAHRADRGVQRRLLLARCSRR